MSDLVNAVDIGRILIRSLREAETPITPRTVDEVVEAVLLIRVGDKYPFWYSLNFGQLRRILTEDVRR